MTKRIAKRGDTIQGTCLHFCHVPGSASPAPTNLPFYAVILRRLSPTVFADGQAVAMPWSEGDNMPLHAPMPALGRKQVGALVISSRSVLVNGVPVGADGDAATTCDEKGAPARVVAGACTVLLGS